MVKVIQKSFYIALFLAGILVPVTNVYADGNTTDFSITVNPSLSLSVSSSTVGFEITPTQTGAYNSSSFNVYSSTNNVTGYTLTMSTNKVNLESNTVNPNTGTNPTIPTLTETQDGITAAAFEASTSSDVLNHYGVSIAGANYNAMKTEKEIKRTTENNTTQDTTAIALASKLDLLTVPGIYSTTLNFQITANFVPITLENAYTGAGKTKATIGGQQYYAMQDMTTSICEAANVIDDVLEVYDNRDNTIYHIGKLADNRCWLLDNLALDPTDSSVQTKLAGNTNATDDMISNFISGGNINGNTGWSSVAVAQAHVGDSYTNADFLGKPLVYTTDKLVVPQNSEDPLNDLAMQQSWKAGVQYNYCAVSVGTLCYSDYIKQDPDPLSAIDMKNDICPTGWRIPTGGGLPTEGGQADGGDYALLFDSYPTIDGEHQSRRFRKILRIPLSGNFSPYLAAIGELNVTGSHFSSTYGGYYEDEGDEIELINGTYCGKYAGFGDEEYGCFRVALGDRDAMDSVRCIAK